MYTFNDFLSNSTFLEILQATMVTYTNDVRLNDIRYNALLPIAITGIVFGVFFVLMALVTACAAKAESRCL